MVILVLQMACTVPQPLPGEALPEAECANDWGSKADFEGYYVEKHCAWEAACPGQVEGYYEACLAQWSALPVWTDTGRCIDDCTATMCMERVRQGACTEETQDSLCGPWVPFYVCPVLDTGG